MKNVVSGNAKVNLFIVPEEEKSEGTKSINTLGRNVKLRGDKLSRKLEKL